MSADTNLMPIPGPVDPVPVPRGANPRADGKVELVGLPKEGIRAARSTGLRSFRVVTDDAQQHHAAKVAGMSLDAFRGRIETIRDPEVVNQWLEKMKKITRYTWKLSGAAAKPAGVSVPAAEDAPAADGVAVADSAPAPVAEAAPAVPSFDSLEDARVFLLTEARDKVVRTTETARFHGKIAETMPPVCATAGCARTGKSIRAAANSHDFKETCRISLLDHLCYALD